MEIEYRMNRVFRGTSVVVDDCCCRPTHSGKCGEENSNGYSITFVRRGAFAKHVGRQSVTANPNHVVFFNRGESYEVTHPVGGGDDCTVFGFRWEQLVPFFEIFDPSAAERPTAPLFKRQQSPCDLRLFADHVSLLRRIRLGLLTDIAAEEAILSLVERILSQTAQTLPTRQSRKRETRFARLESADAAVRLLSGRFREPLNLADIARSVHSSAFHLCRIFREHTGLSIHQYRTQLRLRASLVPLAEGRTDLTRLALELGFADHSHFSNAFRRTFGFAPTAFRRTANSDKLREMSTNIQV